VTDRKLISSGSPFERAYGYSRAVIQGDWAFIAGTTGYDYASMAMPESVGEQARQCWVTIAGVLGKAGFSLEDIVRCNYYVTAPQHAESVLQVCGEILRDIRPAATIVIVSGLLKPEMKVEIEVTALKR